MPALPLHEAGKYVAAAYLVSLALILDLRGDHGQCASSAFERELGELANLAERSARRARDEPSREEVPA